MHDSISVLVFTPTPTHPPVQGNRQRIFDVCRAMQSMGAELTVVYYAIDGLGTAEARQMRESWGDVEVVFHREFAQKRSLVRYPAIDDWYDPAITETIERLCRNRQFDLCIVNYVWYSRLLDSLPPSVVRVIDTHDVFGGRAQRFTDLGLTPEWFHTSAEQESAGLDRSDFVFAIQNDEVRTLQERTTSHVRLLGFLSAPHFLARTPAKSGSRLKAGYLGSGNPFNVASMLAFARAIGESVETLAAIEFHVAGPICESLSKTSHPFLLRGTVESLEEFYDSVDVVVNPMVGGTGLKIKSLEALSFGMPLAATADAMTGIQSAHPGHRIANPRDLVQWLEGLAREPSRLDAEAEQSRRVFSTYRKSQLDAFRALWAELEREIETRRSISPPRATESLAV